MRQPSDDNTFLLTGYLGTGRSKDDFFLGCCIANDKASAIELMAETVPTLNPTGITSLAEYKNHVEMLEKVKTGQIPAPRQKGFGGA